MEKIDLGNISLGGSSASAPQVSSQVRQTACPPVAQVQNDIYYDTCEDAKSCDMGDTVLEDQGRILDLSLTLKNVCPGKRVALGVALTEVDSCQNEYPRGIKTMTIPAHSNICCTDIPVTGMRFIMPEDISVSGSTSMCTSQRHFIVRVDAHYIDMSTGSCGCDCGCSAQ